MIKVQVPRISPQDVRRMEAAMEGAAQTAKAIAPIFLVALAQVGQQAVLLARTLRETFERETREAEVRRGTQ